jgi:hypothetical protein
LIILLAGINYSCKKDDVQTNTNPTPVTPTTPGPYNVALPGNSIVFSVAGKVIDENNNAVSGATVSGGGVTVRVEIPWRPAGSVETPAAATNS